MHSPPDATGVQVPGSLISWPELVETAGQHLGGLLLAQPSCKQMCTLMRKAVSVPSHHHHHLLIKNDCFFPANSKESCVEMGTIHTSPFFSQTGVRRFPALPPPAATHSGAVP